MRVCLSVILTVATLACMQHFSKVTLRVPRCIKTLKQLAEHSLAHHVAAHAQNALQSKAECYPHMLWIRLWIDRVIPPRNGVK